MSRSSWLTTDRKEPSDDVVDRWRERIDLRHVWQPNEGFRKALRSTWQHLRPAATTSSSSMPIASRGGVSGCDPEGGDPAGSSRRNGCCSGESFSRRVVTSGFRSGGGRPSSGSCEHLARWAGPDISFRPGTGDARGVRLARVRASGPAYSLIGVSRSDFERVNGFDARCRRFDDGEDQDLAIRLRRSGLRCGWAGPSSTVLHLWHPPRAYRAEGHTPLFRTTETDDRFEAVVGLRELDQVTANRVGLSSSSSEPVNL